jgi:ferritin-like metal-binding protein YciE
MADTTAQEHIDDYLSDAHSIEEQALVQMKRASKIAGDPALAQAFQAHERETEEHERLVRDRLAAHDGKPSAIKEAVMKAGGVAFILFAKANPDTPGKLTAHGYSYEHLEIGSYELLKRVAQRAGDQETVAVAERILVQERAMAQRLEDHFDDAVEASLRDVDPDDLRKQVAKYLADAHALETQAISLLEGGRKVVGDDQLAALMDEHLHQERACERLVTGRLEALGERPSRLKDVALGIGGMNWSGFFAAHPDPPGKLAAFAYAFEHLEIAGYELLKRVAQRAGDQETVTLAERILRDERGAADKIAAHFDHAAEAALAAH